MIVSPHCHPESPLTGSALPAMVKRAKELGRKYFAYTDNGHMASTLQAYQLSKDAGLKFMPGIEIYFKDNKCPIISGTEADRCKYFTATLYCETQEAFQNLSRIISTYQFPTIEIFEENQQLWSWDKLEEIAKYDVNVVLGGPHCMVGKVLLASNESLAEKVFVKLKDIFNEKLFVSLICEPWSKKWSNVVEIKFEDGTSDSLLGSQMVSTDRARRIRAIDLTERSGHGLIKSKSIANINFEINKSIKSVKLHKGFLPLPGGDITLRMNKLLMDLSFRHFVKMIASDYAYYARKEDKIVQTMRLEGKDKLHSNLYMKSKEEILSYLQNVLNIDVADSIGILCNNEDWAKRFDNLQFKYEWRLAKPDGDPLRLAMDIIKKNGRMKWDNPIWVSRLREELNVIAKNQVKDLTPYFLPIYDVLNYYKDNNQLVGPGRGSAGGSLFVYLLGITQIDPFKYDLPFQRFFSLDRIMGRELPDIDVDLPSRDLLVGEDGKSGYLYGKYGDKAAQISTRTTIRLKSAIKDTNRYFNGKVLPEIEIFAKGLPQPAQGISDTNAVFGFTDKEEVHHPGLIETNEGLIKYANQYPKEWEIVSKAMGITRAFSKHASAFVLSDNPIYNNVPVKDGHVAQYNDKMCEKAGLIKYDFLVIHQLKDIEVCLKLINQKNKDNFTIGDFTHNGVKTYIWDLPEDSEVYKSVWSGRTETCFQINTKSMIPFVIDIMPQNIMDLATILALVRPGPMDFIDPATGRNMVEEYVMRRKGESEPDIKELMDLLPETYGILAFQEQLGKIARDLAGFPGPRAETLRKHMAKKNMVKLMDMKPDFMAGATQKVSKEIAEGIWDRMVTFGRYGFSIIHAVLYAHTTYACMFFKHHYPLEWWAAILTNAEEQEITGKFWPYVKDIVTSPDINLSTDSMVIDYDNGKIRAKLGIIRGIGESTINPILEGRPYRDIQDFVDKEVSGPSLARKLIHVGVLDSLFAPKSNLIEKLKAYENAVEIKKFRTKKSEAELNGKKMKATQPKEGIVPEEYLYLTPFKDIAMKKSVLPSMPIDIHSIARVHSRLLCEFKSMPTVKNNRGFQTSLINGDRLKIVDELDPSDYPKDIYVASTCYVIKVEEFSYPKAKPTKRALKMILDVDGYVTEKVLWPDYNTGELIYPQKFEQGAIATIFFRRKVGKPDTSVTEIVVET